MGTPRQKRVTAAIILTTLGLCSLFLAQGTTNMIGAALIDDAPIVGAPREELLAARAELPDRTQQTVDHEKVKLMLRGPEAPADADAGPADEVDAGPIPLGPCDGAAKLTAVLMSNQREWSMIAVTLNTTSRLYREGSALDGKTVELIEQERAYLTQGARRCYLTLFEEGETPVEGTATPTAAEPDGPTARPSRATRSGISSEEMSEGITRQSDRNFSVQRSFLNEVMENQAEIMRTARVIPHEENGRVVGVKMYGIRRNSVLGQLGIQNGDMVRTINGFDLTSPDSALEAYTRLTGADQLTLSVVRRGQPMTIEYNIQ